MEEKYSIHPIYLILMNFVILIKGSIITSLVTSLPNIQIQFSLNNSQLGWISTIFYLMSLIGAIIWSYLINSKSLFNIFLSGSLCVNIGLISIYLSKTYILILISIGLTGFGVECLTIVIFNIYNLLLKQEQRGKGISLFFIFQGLGSILGIFITGQIIDLYHVSWNNMFLFIFFFIIGTSSLTLVFIFKHKKGMRNNVSDNEETIQTASQDYVLMLDFTEKRNFFTLIKQIFSKPINKYIFIFFFFFFPIQQINNTWIQKYWIDVHNLTQTMASISLIFVSGAEFLGIMLGGFIIDRLKTNFTNLYKLGIIACLFGGIALLIGFSVDWSYEYSAINQNNFIQICWDMFLYAMSRPYVFTSYILLFIGNIFIQLITPLIPVVLTEKNDKNDKIMVINLVIILMNFGFLIAPLLSGIIADYSSFKVVLGFSPLFYVIGTFFFLKMLILNKKPDA